MIANETLLYFAGELAGLVTCTHQAGRVRYPVDRRASIKDVVEAVGVPHTEIHAICAHGRDHDFSMLVEPQSEIALLPADLSDHYPVDVTRPTLLREPLPGLRFLVDENVAGLVPLLRTLGFDAAYDRKWDDEHIARMVKVEQRVLLTRDRALLKRSAVTHGRLIRSQVVDEQLLEVLGHFRIAPVHAAFTRCLSCNVVTVPVDKTAILHRLEPKTRKHYDVFRRCPACDRIYWAGSHVEKLMVRFTSLGIDMTPFLPE